jgi:hypothetical protein
VLQAGRPLSDARQGEAITTANVGTKPVFTKQANMMAAIITVPRTMIEGLRIREGLRVQICRHAQPFGAPAKVVALSCNDNLSCTVIIDLPKIAGQTVDPDDLADATLATMGSQTACQRPSP